MDWPETTEPNLTIFPRGMKRDGGRFGEEIVVKENAVQWVSKYGSMVVPVYGMGSVDGFNERGLGMHMLYLRATDLAPRDVAKPGIQYILSGQYILDEGLKAMTIWVAEQYGEQDAKGSLEPGKLADLVILDKNPLKVVPMAIKDIKVVETIKEGRTIYRAQ